MNDQHVPLVRCTLDGQWRLCEDIPERGIGSLDEASQAAEDDVCHWGDVGVVVDLDRARLARVVGPDIPAEERGSVFAMAREAVGQ